MVTTRAGSRDSTPAASVRSTATRRTTTVVTEAGTPSSKTRARKSGAQATARTGFTSNAYGVGSAATASRVAPRTLQGFSSAFDAEVKQHEEIQPEPEPFREPSTILSPVPENDRWKPRGASRDSTPESKASTSASVSPSGVLRPDTSKSFSMQREAGLSHAPATQQRDMPNPAAANHPTFTQQLPAIIERIRRYTSDLYSGVKAFLADYWKLLLVLLLALTCGSLLATYGIPTLDRFTPSFLDSTPHIPHVAASVTTIVSYLPHPSPDIAVTIHLRHLESRVTFLEEQISNAALSPDNTPPFNHISASIGATIIPGLTSPTKRTVSSLLIPLSRLWTPPGMKGPLTALMPWSEPGQCWCTPASRASLGVRAPYPIRARSVTIEHVTEAQLGDSGHDVSTAPAVTEIWARTDAAGSQECFGVAPEKKGWACLGRMQMKRFGGQDLGRWTVELESLSGGEVVVAQDFAFVVRENRGNVEATCLYRVQIHGEKA